MKVICNGKAMNNMNSKCVTGVDNSTISTMLESYYANTFNVSEGLVSDPFRESTEKLQLWKNPSNKSWLWLNTTTSDIVYMQDFRPDIKKNLVYFIPQGFQGDDGVSTYNFQHFKCSK